MFCFEACDAGADPPSKERASDSKTNEVRMPGREKPLMRGMAISLDLFATAATIVFMAAKHDPIAIANHWQ